jgi:HD-like signal output (HDOD) protein
MQQGLEQWQTFLSDKQLPILLRTKTDVQALIDQAQLSITQYAAPVFYDAGFSAHIFRYVNTQREASGKNPLTTLSNALSHLGQSSFQEFLNKTQIFESLKLAEKNAQGYLRVMGQSCHGAFQATEWAQQRNVVETEETQLAALLQNITELMLWCYGNDAMPKIEEQCYVKKQAYEDAAKTVLGCGMRELGARLASGWNLPEMAIQGLMTKQDNFTLATGVSIASDLARIVSINWYGKEAIQIISRIAKYKGKAEGEIEHRLHLNAVNVNDVLLDRGFDAPAKLLFQLADDDYVYPEFVFNDKKTDTPASARDTKSMMAANAVKVKTKTTAVDNNSVKKDAIPGVKKVMSSDERKAILEKIKARKLKQKQAEEKLQKPKVAPAEVVEKSLLKPQEPKEKTKTTATISKALSLSIKEFKLMVAQGKPAHDLIEHAVKACLLCGVQRSVFIVKVPNKDLLVSRYTSQVSESVAIKALKIPINKPHVFKLLMEKSRGLFLNDSNAMKYWELIPEPVKLVIGVRRFFAMSVFVNNHAMGLMYSDKVKGELTQEEFKQFQGICRLLSKGIAQSAHNKRAKSHS